MSGQEFRDIRIEMPEVTKLKSHVEALQEKKKSTLEELGNTVYVMFLEGVFDEESIKKKCESINEIDSQLKDKEEELKQTYLKAQEELKQTYLKAQEELRQIFLDLKAQETQETQETAEKPKVIAICECGAEIYEDEKFCGKCGKRVGIITTKVEEVVPHEKVCSSCGAPQPPEAKFCSKCGASVERLYI